MMKPMPQSEVVMLVHWGEPQPKFQYVLQKHAFLVSGLSGNLEQTASHRRSLNPSSNEIP